MANYPEYKKVRAFFGSIDYLLKTGCTMSDIFFAITHKKHNGKKALTYLNEKDRPVSIKYKAYRSLSYQMASRLEPLLKNFPEGSVIGLKIANSTNWPLLFWGILMNGYVPFLIDAKLPKANTEVILKDAKAKALISNEITNYENAKNITFNVVMDVKPNLRFAAHWANEVIFCSSGTTGAVKLMIFNGYNLVQQIAAALDMPETTGDIMYAGEINILAMLPFHHIFGFVAVFLWYSFFGKNIVFSRDLSPKNIMVTCQKAGVTHLYSVPLFWDNIAQSLLRKAELDGEKKVEILSKMIAYNTHKITDSEAGTAASPIALRVVQDQLLGHKIKFAISGGGYISEETLNTINGIGYHLYNGFGMTEVGVTSVELSRKVEYRVLGSIGRPLHGVEYKIKEINPLRPNEGELLIKSPITHVREIINGEERETVLEDGYLPTGDIAFMDEAGFYFIRGRIKDVIINENGENIYPDEIESYFKDLKHVANLCCLGVRRGKSTHEEITLILEPANDVNDVILKELKDKCNEINATLQNEKRVARFLLAKDKLPLTSSMKVKRVDVKSLIKSNPDAFTGFDQKKEVKSFEGFKKEEVEPVVIHVRDIFARVLLLPVIKVNDDDHWINDLGGDSMSYVELINTINEEFEIDIPEEKYAKLVSVNDFAYEVLLLKKGEEKK